MQQILQIWKSGQGLAQEMERQQIRSSYTAMSWACLLSGYGFFPETRTVEGGEQYADKVDMAEIDEFVRRLPVTGGCRQQIFEYMFDGGETRHLSRWAALESNQLG